MSRLLFVPALLSMLASTTAAHASKDITLAELVTRARKNAPLSVEARGQVGVAESSRVGARLGPLTNPHLEVLLDRGSVTRELTVASQLHIPLELFGQRSARIAESDKLVAWRATWSTEMTARVTAETVLAYGQHCVAHARVDLARRAEADSRAEAAMVLERLKSGDLTVVDRMAAESEVGRWAQLRAEAWMDTMYTRARLVELTGDLPADFRPTNCAVPKLQQPHHAKSLEAMVATSPSVLSHTREASYWGAAAERWGKEALAPLALVVTAGRGDVGEARVGGGLSWSFPIARRNQGEIARSVSEQRRAEATSRATQQALLTRARTAVDLHAASQAAVSEQQTIAVAAAERAVRASVDALRAGKTDLTRVLIARRDLAQAETRQLDLVLLGWRAYAELSSIRGALP